jgi:hypothetical protein
LILTLGLTYVVSKVASVGSNGEIKRERRKGEKGKGERKNRIKSSSTRRWSLSILSGAQPMYFHQIQTSLSNPSEQTKIETIFTTP